MDEPYWGSEEFEDLVARGLIMCFEDKIRLYENDGRKRTVNIPNARDVHIMRRLGPYFAPEDRQIWKDEYQYKVDGIPDYASFAFYIDREPGLVSGYLENYVVERLHKIPHHAKLPPARYVAFYKLAIYYGEKHGLNAITIPAGITENDKIVIDLRFGDHKERDRMKTGVSGALGYKADSKYLWNVQAIEETSKATFGVYPSQIKSLLYARDLPLTATGRKRPILHWVRSHRRRMQNGTEVDIDKHLRGISEFEMNGTQFRITRPVKQPA